MFYNNFKNLILNFFLIAKKSYNIIFNLLKNNGKIIMEKRSFLEFQILSSSCVIFGYIIADKILIFRIPFTNYILKEHI